MKINSIQGLIFAAGAAFCSVAIAGDVAWHASLAAYPGAKIVEQERGLVHYAPKFKPSSYAEFPDVQSLPKHESALVRYVPNFTIKQFMSLYYSNTLEDRRYAELFLLGVIGAIEGKPRHGYHRMKPDTILEILHSGLSKLDESRYNERAGYVITEIFHEDLTSHCKEK
jgi:hypothetical protein